MERGKYGNNFALDELTPAVSPITNKAKARKLLVNDGNSILTENNGDGLMTSLVSKAAWRHDIGTVFMAVGKAIISHRH